MAAYNINSGGEVNWDTLTGGSVNATLDTYTISNNSTLVIDTDSYQCANHSAAFGSLDTVSYTGIGGKLKIDGTKVRVIPFNTGTGNVPAIGTSIVQGGVSATLLGVWANWQSEPIAAGAAMPASGFIKVKNKTGGNYTAGALTNIGATATGADVVGWIEIRGADTATITIPRIGAFESIGDWFELGTTNGTRGQVLACPTTATVAGVFPGVWIETGVGTNVYERFTGCGNMVAITGTPTDERGKLVWQTTSGIRIGSDGTNNVGFLPPSGCRVRIPNIILTCCTRTAGSGSGPRVLPNAALATRQEFITTSSGDINMQDTVCQWYANFVQAYGTVIRDSAVNDSLVIQEISQPLDIDNVIVAPTQAQLNFALNALNNYGGGNIANCLFVRFSMAATNAFVCQFNFNSNINITNVKSQTLTNRTNAAVGTWSETQNNNCVWTDCIHIGGKHASSRSQNCQYINGSYSDTMSGTTGTALTQAMYDLFATTNAFISGVDFLGLTNVHPYGSIVYANATINTTVRLIGTPASPRNLGSANACGAIVESPGSNTGLRMQRLYASNTRTNPWILQNTDNDVIIDNVFGDYADNAAIASLNTIARGVALIGQTAGQTAVYGTHWKDSFTSATVGKIEILCNEPTALSAAQCAKTGGTPRFNSVGQVALTTIGDQVTWTMPYFAIGHTALANLAPTLTGTNTGNMTYQFQWDTGSGMNGTWLTLNAANLNAVGAINPATGIKLMVQATCATANAGNLLTNIAIATVTTATAQQNNVYPLDVNTLTLTGLQPGSDVVIYEAGTTTVLASVDANAGSTYAYTYSGADTIDIGVFLAGYIPLYIRNLAITTTDSSLPISQVVDRAYLT